MAILSIFKEAEFLKVALLVPEKKLFRILFLEEFSLENFEISDLLYTIKQQTQLDYKDLDVISPLETRDISIKQTKYPFKGSQKIKKALKFFSLENFFFNKDNLVVCPLNKNSKNTNNYYLYATSKHLISKHINLYTNLDLTPDSVTCIPAALNAFACNFCNTSQPIFVINVGFDRLNMIFINNQFCSSCFSHPIGLKDFIDALIDNDFCASKIDADLIKEIIETILSVKEHSHPLRNCTNILKETIERFINSCIKKEKIEEPIQLLFTGYGFIIEKAFCHKNYSIAPQTTKHHIEYDSFTLKRYAIELGSALQLTKFWPNQLLFPQAVNSNSKTHKKIKHLAKSSLLSALALFAILFCFSTLILSKQKRKINKGIELLSQKMQIKNLIKKEDSLKTHINKIKESHSKTILHRTKNKKIQSLGQILNSIHQASNNLKIDSFSFKKLNEHLLIKCKVQNHEASCKNFITNLKQIYKKNLLTLEENNGTIQFTLKY